MEKFSDFISEQKNEQPYHLVALVYDAHNVRDVADNQDKGGDKDEKLIVKSAKKLNLVPSAVIGKLFVACFAVIFIDDYSLIGNDLIIVPLMCLMCVAIPFVLVTIAPRFITAAEVNLFFLLETIIGPIWVWLIIKEQPTTETILGGIVIIVTIAVHSFLKLKKS